MLDCLITNARIVDPEGGGDFYGSLGIRGGKIALIREGPESGTGGESGAKRILDARGCLLVPGFIDIHAHTDSSVPCAEKLLSMGVTTAVSGNCGLSPVDFPAFFRAFEARPYPINQAEQAGHTELRRAAGQGDVRAPASADQITRMKGLVQDALDAGAAGLSFGLEYVPGASPQEVLELASLAGRAGRPVSIHTRVNGYNDTASLREALDLSVKTGGRVIISHLVYMYTGEELKRAAEVIDGYRDAGADVWVDSGMYTAFASFAGTPLFDEKTFFGRDFSFEKLRAATGKYAGQFLNMEKYKEMRNCFPNDSFIYDHGTPEDICAAYALADVMVSTDCIAYPDGQGHPQGAATYPFFLRTMVKERKQLSLVEGLRRCSFLPAEAMGYLGKGRIKTGADADLAILDWDRLRERADFPGLGNPGAAPEGITHVFVNGVLALEKEERIPGVFAGKCLYAG